MSRDALAAALLVALSLLCYANSLWGELVWDDIPAIVENDDVRAAAGHTWSMLFTNDFWGRPLQSSISHKSWRPLTTATFRLNHNVHGLRPFGYHVTNVAIHALASFQVHLLGCRLAPTLRAKTDEALLRRYLGPVSGVLFCVHPVHVEAVANVVCRAELLSGVCFLGAVLTYMRYTRRRPPPNRRRDAAPLVGTVTLCGVGLLCKEQAVTALGACVAYELLCVPRPRKGDAASMQRVAVLLSATAALLVLRGVMCGGLPEVFSPEENPAAFHADAGVRALTYLYLAALNGALLLHPARLCCEWGGSIPLVTSLGDERNMCTAVVLLLVTLLGVPGVAAGARLLLSPAPPPSSSMSSSPSTPSPPPPPPPRRPSSDAPARGLAFLVVLMVIPFLPSSNLFLTVGFMLAERVLYLPSVGFCLLVALALLRAVGLLRRRRPLPSTPIPAAYGSGGAAPAKEGAVIVTRAEALLWVGLAGVALAHALKTVHRSRDWSTPEALFVSGIAVNPGNYKMHYSLGTVLSAMPGREAEAEAAYRASVALKPEHAAGYNNLGLLLNEQKRYEEAEEAYNQALRVQPNHAKAMSNLGMVLQVQEARRHEAEALHRRQAHMVAYSLGDHLQSPRLQVYGCQPSRSIRERENGALEINHWDHKVHNNLGLLLGDDGRYAEAEESFHNALQLAPNEHMYHNNLGALHYKAGNHVPAERCFRNALRLQPAHASSLRNLVLVLHAQGTLAKVHALCETPQRRQDVEVQQACNAIAYTQHLAEQNKEMPLHLMGLQAHDTSQLAGLAAAERFMQQAAKAAENNLQDALDAALKAVEAAPHAARTHLLLARIYARRKQFPEAQAAAEETLRLDPRSADALHLLGGIHAQRGEIGATQAIEFYEKALEVVPNSFASLHDMAVVLNQVGKGIPAREAMKKALRVFPASPSSKDTNAPKLQADLHNNLGAIHAGLGEWGDAKFQFETAIRMSPGGEHPRASDNLQALRRDGHA